MLRWRVALTILILAGFLVGSVGPTLAAPPRQEDQAIIVSPTAGSTVSGRVDIIGTVTHPSFVSYGVRYAPGAAPAADSQWVPIVIDVEEPVVNGVLATWDTTAIPDGVYTLELTRYREGVPAPDFRYVNDITVSDEAGAPTPTPTLTPLPTAAPGTPTAVPVERPSTPTPVSSATPRPGETPAAVVAEEGEEEGPALDLSRLRTAFFNGVKVALLLFVLWGLYVFGRAVIRYLLRTGQLELPWGKK
jgi:hypothetical protein